MEAPVAESVEIQRPLGALALSLSHYSDKHVRKVYSTASQLSDLVMKPKGFWVSVDGQDDWKSWCQAEEFHLHRLTYRHKVYLTPEARTRVLTLEDEQEVLSFSNEFSLAPSRYNMDWAEIAKRWAGVIIAPYMWELRRDTRTTWYYGWDCASGCIWDASVIRDIKLR